MRVVLWTFLVSIDGSRAADAEIFLSVTGKFKVASLLSACLIFLEGCASPLGTFGSGVAVGLGLGD